MTLPQLRKKFDGILKALSGTSTVLYCTVVENAYETYVLVTSIKEFASIEHGVASMTTPSTRFLNQKPGKFRSARSFKVIFHSGKTLHFATEVEVFGSPALDAKRPMGIKFEADVVVINERDVSDVETTYNGYPAPQHLMAVYDCKFGLYNKSQLRELLGLRRHISYLTGRTTLPVSHHRGTLHQRQVINSTPAIPLLMARPKNLHFFDLETKALFDLHQIVVK